MIIFIKKILPTIVTYTDEGIGENYGGYASGMYIVIRPKYQDDKGILEHEKIHVWQWYRTFGFHSAWYKSSEKYRLKCEVEAFKVQLATNLKQGFPDYTDYYAERLSVIYGINISKEASRELLMEG